MSVHGDGQNTQRMKNHVGFVIFNHGCFLCSEALLCPEMFVGRLFKNMHLSRRVHRADVCECTCFPSYALLARVLSSA